VDFLRRTLRVDKQLTLLAGAAPYLAPPKTEASGRNHPAAQHHGVGVTVVQARLGHASAAETLDTYAHRWPDSEDRTRQAIDGVLGRSGDSLDPGQVLRDAY
jgi:integrase